MPGGSATTVSTSFCMPSHIGKGCWRAGSLWFMSSSSSFATAATFLIGLFPFLCCWASSLQYIAVLFRVVSPAESRGSHQTVNGFSQLSEHESRHLSIYLGSTAVSAACSNASRRLSRANHNPQCHQRSLRLDRCPSPHSRAHSTVLLLSSVGQFFSLILSFCSSSGRKSRSTSMSNSSMSRRRREL